MAHLRHVLIHHLGGLPYAHDEKARRHRVQGTRVANLTDRRTHTTRRGVGQLKVRCMLQVAGVKLDGGRGRSMGASAAGVGPKE